MEDKKICNFDNAASRYVINVYICFALLAIGLFVIGYGIDLHSPSYSWRNMDYSSSNPIIPLEIFIVVGVAIVLYSLPAFVILMKKCLNCKNYSYYMTATEFCEQCSNTVKHIPLDKICYKRQANF